MRTTFCILPSYCVCVYHVTGGMDTEKETSAVWVSDYSCLSRNSSCLSLRLSLFITKQQLFESQIIPVYHETAAVWVRLFLFITKQQLFESQIIPVYHETAAVWVSDYSCLSRNSSCLSLRLFLFITKERLFQFPIIPVFPGATLIPLSLSVCLSVCTHIMSECPLIVSSGNVFAYVFQVRCSRSICRGFLFWGVLSKDKS